MMKTETVTYCNICRLTDCCDVFQARNIKTGDLAAVKIIKLEPGKSDHLIITPAFPSQ